jgi:hypothetical protein
VYGDYVEELRYLAGMYQIGFVFDQ